MTHDSLRSELPRFTARQSVLVDRLRQMVRRIEDGLVTPYSIREIGIFGSFCRNKSSPRDLDLVLTGEQSPIWRRFRDEIVQEVHAAYERLTKNLLYLPDGTPGPAQLIESLQNLGPERQTYASWYNGWSWESFYDNRTILSGWHAPEKITRRLLTEGLPSLKVACIDTTNPNNFLKAAEVITAWSVEKPEFDRNIQSMSTSETCSRIVTKDLANFDRQLAITNYRLLQHEVAILGLLNSRRRNRPLEGNPFDWFWGTWCKQPEYQWLADPKKWQDFYMEKYIDECYVPVDYEATMDELAASAERKRVRLRALYTVLEVYEFLLNQLVVHKANTIRVVREPSCTRSVKIYPTPRDCFAEISSSMPKRLWKTWYSVAQHFGIWQQLRRSHLCVTRWLPRYVRNDPKLFEGFYLQRE